MCEPDGVEVVITIVTAILLLLIGWSRRNDEATEEIETAYRKGWQDGIAYEKARHEPQ